MLSKSETTFRINSDNLITKTLISNATEKLGNMSAKCKPNLADRFDCYRLADKLNHHRNIGAADVNYKSKRRIVNVEIKCI